MKRLFSIALFALAIPSVSFGAFGDEFMLGKASFTATNDTTMVIPNTLPGTVLWNIILSTVTSARIKIYDSSGTANNQIGDITSLGSGSGAFSIPFEVKLSSGLTYTTSGLAGTGFTIIYKITRP